MHFREIKYSSNTGRLASLCLPNSEIRLRGGPDARVNMDNLVQLNRQSLVLQLCDEAIELNKDFKKLMPGPYNLIVPDGNWRQAMKMHRREPVLRQLPKIKLPLDLPSRYRLRREHKLGGLSTIEAIARVMGILEGPSVQKQMEDIFELMVERSLKLRPWRASIE